MGVRLGMLPLDAQIQELPTERLGEQALAGGAAADTADFAVARMAVLRQSHELGVLAFDRGELGAQLGDAVTLVGEQLFYAHAAATGTCSYLRRYSHSAIGFSPRFRADQYERNALLLTLNAPRAARHVCEQRLASYA